MSSNTPDRPTGTQRNRADKYKLGVHPLHNPAELTRQYQPLLDYLNDQIHGVKLSLKASRDYADHESKIMAGRFHFLLPNPMQTSRICTSAPRSRRS